MKEQKRQNPFRASVQGLRFTWRALKRYDRRILWISLGIVVLSVAVFYTEIFFPKLSIGLLLEGAAAAQIVRQLGGFLLLAVGLRLAYEYCLSKRTWLLSYIGQGSSHELLMKNLSCRYDYSQDADTQALYNRLRQMLDSNATNCYVLALHAATDMAAGALGFIVYAAILGSVDWRIVCLLLVTSAVHFFVMRRVSLYERQIKKQTQELYKKLEYLYRVTGELSAAKDARLYQGAGWLLGRLNALISEEIGYSRKRESGRFLGHAACAAAALVRDGLAYVWLIHMVLNGGMTLDDFVLAIGAVRGLSGYLLKILDGAVMLNRAQLYTEEIRGYVTQGEEVSPERPLPVSVLEKPIGIEFQEVSFTYPQGKQIFNHFSLKIRPGESVALVGINGAGKTTMVHLLCGLYRPDEGRILLNGRDIRCFEPKELFTLFAPVFQDNFLMPTTLGANVAVRSPDDTQGIWECLTRAGLAEDLKAMGKTPDSQMTRIAYEDGLELSGGQKQKLYLARMLYRDAPIAVLDEPTSALDALAEHEVYQQYQRFMEGRTAIFISHRLASTRFCDRILLLENGGIAEAGTHEELMARQGAYYKMFSVQSRYYKEEMTDAFGEGYYA